MDFSKVRLANFAQARLRDVAGQESSDKNQSPLSAPKAAASSADMCAHAPQYSVTLSPLVREALAKPDELRDVQLDPLSQYTLAVTSEGVLVWRQGADNSLLFPLPETHAVSVLLVPASAGTPTSQPGLVAIDTESGNITYWESVNRAVGAPTRGDGPKSIMGTIASSETGQIRLAHNEFVEIVELVAPVGLVAVTNQGHSYLVNLRDDLGKPHVQINEMRVGSGLFARLRSMGAFARDIQSVKRGRFFPQTVTSEVFIVNRYGDVALWHVGLSGFAELITEARLGSKFFGQMNMLYPNCEVSLIVHDIASEQSYLHILASFAPRSDSPLRFFVVMSLNYEFEVVSVRRLQVYESPSDGTISDNTSLEVGANGVLAIACADAVIMLDSPSRAASSRSATPAGLKDDVANPFRWEESIYLKSSARLLGSQAAEDGSVYIATAMGVLRFTFSADRVEESTTKSRLDQAVFESQSWNPLDLARWSEFEAFPDPQAPQKLAVEIANSQTPFVPAQLPDLGDHLKLRSAKLQKLYKQVPQTDVREIAQAVVAATALYAKYIESTEIKSLVDSSLPASTSSLHEFLLKHTTQAPQLIDAIAAKPLTPATAPLVLSILQGCNNNDLGIPQWVARGSLGQALESLSSQAADSRDVDLLAETTDLLCAVYEAAAATATDDKSAKTQGADRSTIKQLLHELSQMESMGDKALAIARKHRVFSALAPLEVAIWLADDEFSNGEGLNLVSKHIVEYGDRYATAVFDTCVNSGRSSILVKSLAPRHFDLVKTYLEQNKLHQVAWTLAPGTAQSTAELALAAQAARTFDERRIFASLYKLSAYTTGSGDVSEAQLELDLAAAQESLAYQYGSGVASSQNPSALVKHGLEKLDKLLDRDTAIDLLALAPPQAVPETNSNFALGFKLVSGQDIVRQRLLVQQLVCNTNWERVSSATSASQRQKRFKQTLFYHTLLTVPPAYAAQLQHFRTALTASPAVEVKQSYRWDLAGSVAEELRQVAERAASVADKYNVDEIVKTLVSESSLDMGGAEEEEEEATMEVDSN